MKKMEGTGNTQFCRELAAWDLAINNYFSHIVYFIKIIHKEAVHQKSEDQIAETKTVCNLRSRLGSFILNNLKLYESQEPKFYLQCNL